LAMKDEVLCKVICHNLCCLIHSQYEHGIKPIFIQKPVLRILPRNFALEAPKDGPFFPL
jgi:hypothetical protein